MENHSPPQPIRTPSAFYALIALLVLLTVAVIFLLLRSPAQESSTSYDPELEALRMKVKEKRLALGLTDAGESSGLTADALTSRIHEDATSLSEMITALANQLSAKDQLISQKNTEIDNASRARESLTSEIATLTKKLDEARLAATQSSNFKDSLEDSKMLLSAAQNEVKRLKEKLSSAPSDRTIDALKNQLTASQQEVEQLMKKLKGTVSVADIDRLKQENRTLKLALQSLRAETSRQRLFVESSDSLSPNALTLFTQLSSLEGVSNEERLRAYGTIKEQVNARVVESVAFGTGSSSVDVEKVSVITQSLEKTSPQAEYLIVGYASKSGDAASNRELSSQRATTVASIADVQRGAKQTVKAVFLGQTNRFSSTNDYANQVCEIWEILPN